MRRPWPFSNVGLIASVPDLMLNWLELIDHDLHHLKLSLKVVWQRELGRAWALFTIWMLSNWQRQQRHGLWTAPISILKLGLASAVDQVVETYLIRSCCLRDFLWCQGCSAGASGACPIVVWSISGRGYWLGLVSWCVQSFWLYSSKLLFHECSSPSRIIWKKRKAYYWNNEQKSETSWIE